MPTRAELVGIENEISLIIWYGYFFSEQGCQVRGNIFYKDNQSTYKLEIIDLHQVEK